MSSSKNQTIPLSTDAHSSFLATNMLSLARAFESKESGDVVAAQNSIVATLRAEKKIAVQRKAVGSAKETLGTVSLGEKANAKTEVQQRPDVRRKFVVQRGIMGGGCVVS